MATVVPTVTIKRSASFDVTFPDGSELTMRQLGESWEGMMVLADDSGQRLILDTGSYDMQRFIANLFGGGDDTTKVTVIKGAPDLMARLRKNLADAPN